jgi:hypothetical protein
MRRICCLVLALVAVTGGSCRRITRPAVRMEEAPSRSPWGPNVGVVSEVYGKTEEETFNRRTKELVRAAFIRESAYNKTPFSVKHVFIASPGSGLTALKNGQTALGLTYKSASECYYAASKEVRTKITDAFKTPEPQTKVVLVHSDEKGGCSDGDFIYLGDQKGDNNWMVMAHEFGHRLGLLDEIGGEYVEHPKKTELAAANWNCSGCAAASVWWQEKLSTPPSEGCDHYDLGVHRPSNECRMGSNPENEFCLVCKLLLHRTLSHGSSIALPMCVGDTSPIYTLNTRSVEDPDAQIKENHYVRLLVDLSRTGPADNRVQLLRPWDMEGRLQPSVVPGPRYLYAIKVNREERWRFAEFFANDLFVRRSYHASGTHTTTQVDSASVVIRIPDIRLSELRQASDITVAVYRVRNPNWFLASNIAPRDLLGTSVAPLINQLVALGAITLEWQTQNLQGQLR